MCRAGFTTPALSVLDESWIGTFPGEARNYVEHIRAGVEFAAAGDGLLVFSGGQTREQAGRRSEAQSYLEIASDAHWWGYDRVAHSVQAEEYARDSLENLVFSVAVFLRSVGLPPRNIAVTGWAFKEQRFNLHRKAIRWPADRFRYISVNDPPPAARQRALSGELRKLRAAESDPLLRGEDWTTQRAARDPFLRAHPYRGLDSRLDIILGLANEGKIGDVQW